MADDAAEGWRLRVGTAPNPEAPRATLSVRLVRGGTAVRDSYRASVVDHQKRRYAGDGEGPEGAVWRLVEKLVGARRPVWHVAPPGEAVPEDGRPAPEVQREPLEAREVARLRAAKVVPETVRTFAKRVILAGASVGLTDIYEGSNHSVGITLRGVATEAFEAELRTHGFKRHRRRGCSYWYGVWPPPPPRAKETPVAARRLVPVSGQGSASAKSSVDGLLAELYALDAAGDSQGSLDGMFDLLDNLLLSGRMAECDACLAQLDATRLRPVGLIGILTVTASASHLLPSRQALYEAVQRRLRTERNASEVADLLRGLES